MSEVEASVARVIDGYVAAVSARDLDALMRIYDPSVRVYDAWGNWSYEDITAWQVAVEGWFASHPADRFKVVFEDVRSVAAGTFASVSAIVTYAVFSPKGEQLNSMQNRLTWVLRASGHVLRIVHEHTSAPIGFEDQKAILQRSTKA